MTSPKEIIERIRSEKFKIGQNINIEEIKKDLHNSVHKLAVDINKKDIHFVFELIQNADDNEYDVETPLLKFTINNDSILVQNNEKGFVEDNVKALCGVGNSTKNKNKDYKGYTGEKGIGFKSVFRVSDEPHIFSNGFQFKFKKEDKEYGVGYIVPYWLDTISPPIDDRLTNILLPLNCKTKERLSKFSEIKPELLLFLRRLSKIEIHNNVEDLSRFYSKNGKNGNINISCKETTDYFKLTSIPPLNVPETIQEEERDIRKTDLVLAFPINEKGFPLVDSKQQVFAFLPIGSYGFKFIIQADFLLTTDREGIHQDKEWNKWLRDNVSTVFLEAVETFKNDENLKTSFYNYIPIESEITDELFSEVVGQLKDKLSDSNCVSTESGKWLKPSQIFTASQEIRSLISNDNLFEFFGKEYISTLVESNADKKILDFLEIQSFTIDNLIEVLKKTEWLETKSDEWLTQLYTYLSNKLSPTGINTVKKLKIVRLKNGVMESPTQNNIFFPFKGKQVYGFEKLLPFIKKETINENKEFLKKIGVLEPNPFEIIENYILKDFTDKNNDQNWKSKTEEVRIGYINYIKDNLALYEKSGGKLENLGNIVWINETVKFK
jgi:hypothetical protein